MKVYTFVARPGSYAFNKQESIVFAALRALGSGTIEELADECVARGLKTKQAPERIVAYYLVDLKKLGLVKSSGTSAKKTVVVIEDESEVEQIEDQSEE